jgi:hypothetical protein
MTTDFAAAARYPHWRMLKYAHGYTFDEPKSTPDIERMMATARRRNYPMTVDPFCVAIKRPGTGITWRLEPRRDNPVSPAQWRDLAYLAGIEDKLGALIVADTEQGFRIGGHFGTLGAQATHILIERGWIVLPYRADGRARLTLAGRLNLKRHQDAPPHPKTKRDMVAVPGHRTEAYLGPVLPNDQQRTLFRSNGTRRGYLDRDGAGARCQCGWITFEASLSEARDRARQHRLQQRDRLRDNP